MEKNSTLKNQQQPKSRKQVVSKLLELFGGDIKTVYISPQREKLIESYALAQTYGNWKRVCQIKNKVEYFKGLIDMPMWKLRELINILRKEYERNKLRSKREPAGSKATSFYEKKRTHIRP